MNKTFKKIGVLGLSISLSLNSFAQRADGTVNSLVKTDQAFSQKAIKTGIKEAVGNYVAEDAITFSPNPTNTKKYYTTRNDTKNISWMPNFARLSRSRDWGVTSGNFQDGNKKFGHYLSVWRDEEGHWKNIINIRTEANQPIKGKEPKPSFEDPKDSFQPKLSSKKELNNKADIVISTEKILNTMFKTQGVLALGGFLNDDARLMFPGTDLLIGKANVLGLYHRMIDKIDLKITQADRSLGGDFAYTYGLATVDYKNMDLRESFNYLFIWQRQSNGDWNIIEQIYNEAVR